MLSISHRELIEASPDDGSLCREMCTGFVEYWSVCRCWLGCAIAQPLAARAARLRRRCHADLARQPRRQLHGLASRSRNRLGGRGRPGSRSGYRGHEHRRGGRVDGRRGSAALSDVGPAQEPGCRRRRHRDGRVRHLVRTALWAGRAHSGHSTQSFPTCPWKATRSATSPISRRRSRLTRRRFITPNPADYAEVYEAARTALHQVDPTAQAVVGGMLDSGAITLDTAEQYLAAIGPMDAVGFHPYLYDVTTMEQDTTQLRQWLDANGDSSVPLDINEFGAADGVTPGIAAWGAEVAQYTQWALCTPGAQRRERPGVLVGWHPDRRYRPLVLDGRQRALRDSPRHRLPRGGPGADHAGLPGRPGFDPAGGDAAGDQPGGAHHRSERKRSTASARRSRRLPTTSAVAGIGTRPHLGASSAAAPPSGGDRGAIAKAVQAVSQRGRRTYPCVMRRVAIALALLLALPAVG